MGYKTVEAEQEYVLRVSTKDGWPQSMRAAKSLANAAPALLAACEETKALLTLMAGDSEDNGIPERAESARDLIRRITKIIAQATGA